jgi:hypothetical protein
LHVSVFHSSNYSVAHLIVSKKAKEHFKERHFFAS